MSDILLTNNGGNLAETIQNTADQVNQLNEILARLNADQLNALSKSVLLDSLKEQFKHAVTVASIDYQKEKNLFLMQFTSTATKDAYTRAINRAEKYATKNGLNLLTLNYAQADEFCISLANDTQGDYSNNRTRGAESIRRDIAGVSSYFSFLERRHAEIKNPFRQTKARPKKQTTRQEQYPNAQEVETIINALPVELGAMCKVMALRGLRVGALPGLTIRENNRFTTYTKGKAQGGELPQEVIDGLKLAGLKTSKPFENINEKTLVNKVKYYTNKLYKAGQINAPYSCHDLRHFYAVTEYAKDHDIYRVSKLLGHSNISITEIYLRNLNVID